MNVLLGRKERYMERTIQQLISDIYSMKYNFEKSKSLAPEGYEFISNFHITDDEESNKLLDWYKKQNFLVLPEAYNMYGELLSDTVSLYRIKG
jgi:hypothetical protein